MRAPVKDCKRKAAARVVLKWEVDRLRSVSRLNRTCESIHGSFGAAQGDPLTIARRITFAEGRNEEKGGREKRIPLCCEREERVENSMNPILKKTKSALPEGSHFHFHRFPKSNDCLMKEPSFLPSRSPGLQLVVIIQNSLREEGRSIV